jgi:hypothetical protein
MDGVFGVFLDKPNGKFYPISLSSDKKTKFLGKRLNSFGESLFFR